ncbi:abortive infection system antitoxin AbiGi family protein [Clostridium beijerinckii]|nr:abortive infection system antitoxin AbiGi family protein [Clostridium beijerinckii]MZK48993.1 hypothetical protein [Clostridium beijerinckii]MZK57368.1 hypothetical protein [Clostridium beijerinckii]MZK67579.1 hypothetical protein [Clostridium beijerinckii]MZK72664.1 hypothetical protein [Clostridium beijerinckii]MZK82260.1 hypothetical protein [Clostridium beijerinckii]
MISSNTLFHFTNEVDFLKNILKDNFYPRCCTEDLEFLMPNLKKDQSKVAIPMVCFCDIPLSKISNHIDDYGSYGIGLTKEWGIEKGINPIHYIQKKTLAHNNLINLEKQLVRILEDMNKIGDYLEFRHKDKNIKLMSDKISAEIFKSFWEFSGFLKEYRGINNKNEKEEKIFYDEREWRYIPNVIDSDIDGYTYRLHGQDCLSQELKNKLNETLIKYKLKFEAKNVKYLILKNENEITNFMEFIDSLPEDRFNRNEKSILKTKIITVDNIKEDF